MDNAKMFDTLERRVEKVLARLKSLEQENERLKGEIAASRKAEKESSESRVTLERLEKDQEAVRERVAKLIQSLESAEKG
jgi:hypothetical protein